MLRDGSNIFRISHGDGDHSTGNHSRKNTEHQKYHVIDSNGTDQIAERKQRDPKHGNTKTVVFSHIGSQKRSAKAIGKGKQRYNASGLS